MTTSKPSTASDTATKKNSNNPSRPRNRWFRIAPNPDLKDELMRLYWGRSEPRITGLTLKIIGVNAAALIMLLLGILYLGQYQRGLIEAKLETFGAEVQLIATALAEGAAENPDIPAWQLSEQKEGKENPLILDKAKTRQMVHRFGRITGRRIYVFNKNGELIADSHKLAGPGGVVEISDLAPLDQTLQSVQTLKNIAGFILKILPDRKKLPLYPQTDSQNAKDYIDATTALNGQPSLSAWYTKEEHIFLSAAAPLKKNGELVGATLLTRRGQDIEKDIGEVWLNILKAFSATLIITIMLSIYLSGVITRPLRRLARAAEAVRTGRSKAAEIPDLSNRNDEIGELSIALREMTGALWDRMDTIENFAADVSHELKNPLTSLRSALETLAIVKTEKDKTKLMDIITHDLERLDRLISDISKASRLDAELSREKLQRVNLRSLLHNLLDTYEDPLKRKKIDNDRVKIDNITIQIHHTDKQDIIIPGVETRLTQVLENLISNALSFSPKNGTITITIKPTDRYVQIIIEDQGPGIPEGKLETIFERFYSQRPETEDYGKHSGLGLSICKQIIDALGGRIDAENATDSTGTTTGARFLIILPML